MLLSVHVYILFVSFGLIGISEALTMLSFAVEVFDFLCISCLCHLRTTVETSFCFFNHLRTYFISRVLSSLHSLDLEERMLIGDTDTALSLCPL